MIPQNNEKPREAETAKETPVWLNDTVVPFYFLLFLADLLFHKTLLVSRPQ